MKKLIVATTIAGSVAAVGGAVFLFIKNYNIASALTWEIAVKGYLTTPGRMISAAFSGADVDLFRGLGAVAAGVALIVFPIVGTAAWMIVQRSIQTISFGAQIRSRRGVRVSSQADKKGILNHLFEKKSDPSIDLEDAVASLQEEKEPSKLKLQLLSLIERIKQEISKIKPASKPKPIVVKRVQKKSEDNASPSVEAIEFYPQLNDWYQRVRSSGGRDFTMIERARELSVLATKDVREEVIDKDAMSGDLKLRMMDAWASKTEVGGPSLEVKSSASPTPDQSVFARAIEDVEAAGVVDPEDDDEDDLDLEDDVMLASLDKLQGELETRLDTALEEQDESVSDGEEVADDLSAVAGNEVPLGGEDGEAEGASDGGAYEHFRSMVRAAYELIKEADRVRDGEDEWSPELQDDDDRVEEIKTLFNRLDAEAIETGEAKIIQIIDESEDPEWDWFGSILSDMDAERDRVLAIADPDFVDETASVDDDADVDPDVGLSSDMDEDEDGAADTSSGLLEEEPSTEDGSSGEISFEEDDVEPATVEEAASAPASDEEEAAGDEDENDASDVTEHDSSDAVSEDAVKDEENSELIEKSQAVVKDEPAEADVEHEPQDLAIAQLDEIARCDDLLMRWGIEAKSAGANEAKLVHAVVKKDDKLRRRVVGIVHMAATWRTETNVERGRLNLIFRYVPAGIWRIESNDGIRMVNERGDYVGVDDELLEQPEIANSTTVVHFYGPGAPSGLMEKDGKKVCVVSRILSAEEIRGITLP